MGWWGTMCEAFSGPEMHVLVVAECGWAGHVENVGGWGDNENQMDVEGR